MSTILKALKRLDEQRRAESSPRTLEEQVLGASVARAADADARRNKWLFGAGGAAAALLAVGVGFFALRDAAAPAPVEPAPIAAARAPQPAPPAEPRSARTSPGAPIAGTAVDADARAGMLAASAREDALAGDALLPTATQAQAVAAAFPPAAAPPRVAPLPNETALVRERPPQVPTRREPEPRLAERAPSGMASPPASLPTARSETTAAEPALAREPAPEQAAAQRASSAPPPSLRVERTQWHPARERRSALVRIGEGDGGDARELREGDAIDGFVVKEIRPSGVVFLRDGVELKRGVGGG